MSTPFDHIPSCSRTADYTKPTATAPMNTTWKEKVDAAYDMVHALCQPRGSEGSRQWIMSIPARPDYDPDLVITSGLRAASEKIRTLAAEVHELTEENIRLDRKRFENVTYARKYLAKLRTVTAEVDARDAVITELLAMLKPGDEPVPPADPSTLADWNLWSAHHSPWLTKANCYRFACEIAGRTE